VFEQIAQSIDGTKFSLFLSPKMHILSVPHACVFGSNKLFYTSYNLRAGENMILTDTTNGKLFHSKNLVRTKHYVFEPTPTTVCKIIYIRMG
jgi:sugar lactone lactonase YvrE